MTETTRAIAAEETSTHFCAKEIKKIVAASLAGLPSTFCTDQIVSALKMKICRKSRDSVNSALESLFNQGIKRMSGHDFNFNWKIMKVKPYTGKRIHPKTPGVVWQQKNFKSIRC